MCCTSCFPAEPLGNAALIRQDRRGGVYGGGMRRVWLAYGERHDVPRAAAGLTIAGESGGMAG